MTATRNMGEEGMRRALAELGFIVIQLDALGSSPQRSKAFEDFFYGHVGDNGLPDHVAAIRQLAARYPWIDTTRVGIVGHSGGGYSAAAAMLHFPDFFKVGVRGRATTTFASTAGTGARSTRGLYRKIGDSDNYEAEANYKYAANLKGKLLLMTGDMDCNNPPAETLRLVDALEKAGKDFDMLIVTGRGPSAVDLRDQALVGLLRPKSPRRRTAGGLSNDRALNRCRLVSALPSSSS